MASTDSLCSRACLPPALILQSTGIALKGPQETRAPLPISLQPMTRLSKRASSELSSLSLHHTTPASSSPHPLSLRFLSESIPEARLCGRCPLGESGKVLAPALTSAQMTTLKPWSLARTGILKPSPTFLTAFSKRYGTSFRAY